MTDEKNSYVYIIQCGNLPYYKVGISNKPESRLIDLQVANPHELSIILTVNMTRRHVREAESTIHRKYYKNNLRGEWFEFNKGELHKVRCDIVGFEHKKREVTWREF